MKVSNFCLCDRLASITFGLSQKGRGKGNYELIEREIKVKFSVKTFINKRGNYKKSTFIVGDSMGAL